MGAQMSDRRFRELERLAAQGDPEAAARLLQERVRGGEITRKRLELLSFLGDTRAMALTRDWRPELPMFCDTGKWIREMNGLIKSSADYKDGMSLSELNVGRFGATSCIPMEKLRTVIGEHEFIAKLQEDQVRRIREQMYDARDLPLADWAHALVANWDKETYVRVGRAAAHFVLCLWEQEQAEGASLEHLRAERLDGRVEMIPVDGDHLSVEGMERFNIPRPPREGLALIDLYLEMRSQDVVRGLEILARVQTTISLLSQEYRRAPGPMAVIGCLLLISGAHLVSNGPTDVLPDVLRLAGERAALVPGFHTLLCPFGQATAASSVRTTCTCSFDPARWVIDTVVTPPLLEWASPRLHSSARSRDSR